MLLINENKNVCKIYYNSENRIEAIKKSEELRSQGYIVDLLPKEDIQEIKIVKGCERK